MAKRQTNPGKNVKVSWVDFPLGQMMIVADEKTLYMVEFGNRRHLARNIESFQQKTKLTITPGTNPLIKNLKHELIQYFSGKLTRFKTPLSMHGTPFQLKVWRELSKIPYGKTFSYSDIARAIGKPTAFRAVAQAIGANQHAIVIPCHRVINADGKLGGYAAGLTRKKMAA